MPGRAVARGRHSEHRRPEEESEPAGRRSAGPRRAALRERRRRRRRKTGVAGAATVLGVVAVVAVVAYFGAKVVTGGDPAPSPPASSGTDTITTTLLIGTHEAKDGSEGPAAWLTLLSFDSASDSGAVVYIPAHTAAEVPGRGLEGVGDALRSGGIPLLLTSISNMLGIDIDHYIEMSDSDALLLFQQIGELSVDVPAEVRVPAGRDRARVLLSEGLQSLPPSFLVDLLYRQGLDGDENELGSRHIAFWDALLGSFAEDPTALAREVASSDSLEESNADASARGEAFAQLAGAGLDQLQITTLPVQQQVIGDSELYSTDQEELTSFIRQTIGDTAQRGNEVRVQVLNGNGVPGIGQEVATKLVGEGFKVILSGNAQRLDHPKTLIVVYDDSPESRSAAERARELLGVGEIQVSRQQQGIVDLTIVVGKDWIGTSGQGG